MPRNFITKLCEQDKCIDCCSDNCVHTCHDLGNYEFKKGKYYNEGGKEIKNRNGIIYNKKVKTLIKLVKHDLDLMNSIVLQESNGKLGYKASDKLLELMEELDK